MTDSRLIVVTGLPGIGKSTLADRLAQEIGAPAFAGDWCWGPETARRTAWARSADATCHVDDLLGTLVARQLMLG